MNGWLDYLQVMAFDDVQKLQVNASQRYLNLTVWLTNSSDCKRLDAAAACSPAKTPSASAKANLNLSNLFKSRTGADKSRMEHVPARNAHVNEVAIGHVNILLADIAADCMLNTQGHHISTYQLHPADINATLGWVPFTSSSSSYFSTATFPPYNPNLTFKKYDFN